MSTFLTHVDKLKTIAEQQKTIAAGESSDVIDLEVLRSTADDIANTCFVGGTMSAAQMIARRDAYDFVVCLSRLADICSLGRDYYYSECVAGHQVVTERIDYVKATTLIMESAGPR